MKTKLLLLIFIFCTIGCSKEDNKRKEDYDTEESKVSGLYRYWVPSTSIHYIYLYPNGTGIKYEPRSYENVTEIYKYDPERSYKFTWSLEYRKADVYIKENGDSAIVINGMHHKRITDFDVVDPAIIGVWEMEKLKIIYPITYDAFLNKISYNDDAKIEEIHIESFDNIPIHFYAQKIKLTKENLIMEAFVSMYLPPPYHLGCHINPYKITDFPFGYEVSQNELTIKHVITENSVKKLYLHKYKRVNYQ